MIKRKPATSLTIGLFFVMFISGMLLFFEFGSGGIRATHEWSSIAFSCAAIMHIIVHLQIFKRYFQERTVAYILLTFIGGGALYIPAHNDLYAAEEAFQLILNSEISSLTPLFAEDELVLQTKLESLGLEVSHSKQSIAELAESHDMDVYDIFEPLLMMSKNYTNN